MPRRRVFGLSLFIVLFLRMMAVLKLRPPSRTYTIPVPFLERGGPEPMFGNNFPHSFARLIAQASGERWHLMSSPSLSPFKSRAQTLNSNPGK